MNLTLLVRLGCMMVCADLPALWHVFTARRAVKIKELALGGMHFRSQFMHRAAGAFGSTASKFA